MQSLYYLAMLIGVAWLAVWSILPPERRGIGWWPFDMRDHPGRDLSGGEADAAGRRNDRSARPQPGPAPGSGAAAPAADVQHPLPERGAAQSWRSRRDQAEASRRRG